MADNTSTKVLTIDTGGAITNVKDFKDRIEELKGALLGLEKGTEEYNAVANELRSSQEKLTEVMDVARGKAEGVEGSYDNLVATMRELKKEWRATNDEATRTNLGAQILDINNQLKDLDASTGNFQRNVGDYANAFEDAFKTVLGQVGQVNPELARSAGLINQLIPVIKKSTAVATAGLNGIKKAIVSTGIGALVVAVGLIAANWDKITAAIKRSTAAGRKELEQEQEIANVSETIKRIKEDSNTAIDHRVNLLRAQGAEETDILKLQIANQKIEIQRLEATSKRLALIRDEKQEILDTRNYWWDVFGIAENRDIQARNAASKAQEEANKAVQDAKDSLEVLEASLNTILNKKNQITSTTTPSRSSGNTADDDNKEADEILKRLRDRNKKELELLREKYLEEKRILEDAGKDTVELTKEYIQNYLKEWEKGNAEERQKLVELTDKTIAEIKEKAEEESVAIQVKYDLETPDFNRLTGLEKFFGKDMMFNTDNITGAVDREMERLNKIFDINKTALEAEKTELENLLGRLEVGTDEYEATKRRIAQIGIETSNLETENVLANLDAVDKREQALADARKRRLATYADSLSSISNLTSNLATIMEDELNYEMEHTGLSEENAKKRFEDVKRMQLASAYVNMAAGVVSAIAAAQELGPVTGPIMAAINSAAVIAAGTAQINQIKRQQFGNDNTPVTTPSLQKAAIPVTAQPVQNITGQSELTQLTNAINGKPLYVKVTDIEDTQAIQDATYVESTF